MINWSKFHDATLVSIALDWTQGLAVIKVKVFDEEITERQIRCSDFTRFHLPREFPWGPSSSINGIEINERGDGKSIVVEMQSGDTLRLDCRTVTIDD